LSSSSASRKHGVAADDLQSRVERRLLAAVLLKKRAHHALVAADDRARVVRRAVVDDDGNGDPIAGDAIPREAIAPRPYSRRRGRGRHDSSPRRARVAPGARRMRLRPAVDALRRRRRPVRLGSLASTTPFGKPWGFDRGTPVDRWYIERFLARNRADITGRVVEVKDSGYTDRLGHALTERAVLDVDSANQHATHIADLAHADNLPSGAFDCFVLTQTLQLIFDHHAALAHAHRILAPGGVLLLTVPVTSRLCDPPLTDYWRFTPLAVAGLLKEIFHGGAVTVSGHGNVLSQVAFLEGLAAEDLTKEELAVDDPSLPLVVCARAVKAA